jgi:hypothetical protein
MGTTRRLTSFYAHAYAHRLESEREFVRPDSQPIYYKGSDTHRSRAKSPVIVEGGPSECSRCFSSECIKPKLCTQLSNKNRREYPLTTTEDRAKKLKMRALHILEVFSINTTALTFELIVSGNSL